MKKSEIREALRLVLDPQFVALYPVMRSNAVRAMKANEISTPTWVAFTHQYAEHIAALQRLNDWLHNNPGE